MFSPDPATQVIFREEPEREYLGISCDEWGAANCRLMYDLVKTGKLGPKEIPEYLAYTTQIFDMAAIYTWRSILEYDFGYRENQAEYQYPWGSYSPHLCHLLVPRQGMWPNPRQLKGHTGYPRAPETTGGPKPHPPVCRQFLSGNCRFGQNCRYYHPTEKGQETQKNWQGPAPGSTL